MIVSIIALWALGWASLVLAQSEIIEVTGHGVIYDDDKASARDKALDDALRKAVESAVGTMISSETITENFQLLSDKIYSKAEGYVQKYKIIDEREDADEVIVEIRAHVSTGDISNDVDSIRQLIKRVNKPKVLIMIAEQNIGMNEPIYWWGKSGPVSMDMRVVENTLMDMMQEQGFSFVDTEVLSGKKSIRMPVSRLSTKQAMRVADLTDAQIIIVGQAVAKNLGKVDKNVRFLAARAEITARIINTDNGKVIGATSASGFGHQLDAKFAGNLALKNASKALTKNIVRKITKEFIQITSGTNEIRVTVTGFRNRKHLTSFIKVLRNRLRSVKDVREKRMKSGTAVLELDLAGDTRTMATELEAKDFGGEFRIEITAVSNNSIGVKLLP
jgi:hypothetical protein